MPTSLLTLLAVLLILPASPVSAQNAVKAFSPGAYIIDMGQETQTVGNGLKPYGLVYQLIIVEGIPVQWAINASKEKDAADFTAGGKTYRAGSFIVAAERVTAKVLEKLKTWKAKGVVIDGPLAAGFSAPIQKQLTSWPRAILDEQTADKLVVPFYGNAEVPVSSYVTAGNPTMLTSCGDVYVLPHADPQEWTAASGYFPALRAFVADNGYLWAACHAVSALEGIPGGNFLSEDGLVPWTDHDNGSPPFAYAAAHAGDPIMQFMGTLDASTLNGSEQIFLPKAAGWRNTTTIGAYDPDHPGIGSGKASPGPAAVLAYGRAFGDTRMGMVMIEGGHDLNSGAVASRVAAQRAYFNFILLSGVQKAITINEPVFPDSFVAGRAYPLTVTVSGGGVGSIGYLWTSDCGGSFSKPKAASTVFTAPAASGKCVVKVEVSDPCGRANFSSVVSNIVPTGPNDPDNPDDSVPTPTAVPEAKRTLDLFVTFANGSNNDPGKGVEVEQSGTTFPDLGVAVDRNGIPLPGRTDGKCSSCDIGEEGRFVGPVINMAVTGPVEYALRIYDNLGGFVCDFKGRVSESDLPLLESKTVETGAGDRIRYLQRIIWSGRSQDGQRAGTGAYILNADLRYPADPAINIAASSETFFRKFGHVR
ncbi:MAG: hypothetical protein ABI036_18835 [Fibrobacteria bacterium]